MISRRSALFAMILAGLAPATAEERDENGDRRWRKHWYRNRRLKDHELARRALQEGRARPLTDILAIAKEQIGGEVIGVELDQRAGAMVYELRVLRPNGELVEMQLDALTGKVLRQDDD